MSTTQKDPVRALAERLDRDWRASICSEENVDTFYRVLEQVGLARLLDVLRTVSEASTMKSYDAGIVIDAGYKEEAAAALEQFERETKTT
jgi:hypothetical protein